MKEALKLVKKEMHTPGDFVLHGGNTAFANRQKLLFDKLSDAEEECSRNKMITESTDVNVDNEMNRSQVIVQAGEKRKRETRKFRGKESIFKRPEGRAPHALNRNIPDFRRNPHKWMKYSLDDVSNDDMTEQSNTRAALSFLRELKARRVSEKSEQPAEMDVDKLGSPEQTQKGIVFKSKKVNTTSNVEFRKPEAGTHEMDDVQVIDNDDKPIFRSSKIIMPEYVVGQKQKKKNKKEKLWVKVDRLCQLKLDHLNEPDIEED